MPQKGFVNKEFECNEILQSAAMNWKMKEAE